MYACTAMPANSKVAQPGLKTNVEDNNRVLFCHALVAELVNQNLTECLDFISKDLLDTIISTLRKSLLEELEGCYSIPSNSITSIVMTVSRELHQTMGSKETIKIAFLLQRKGDYKIITKTLKKHLLTVQRSIGEVLLNSVLSLSKACLLCCIILPDEEDDDMS